MKPIRVGVVGIGFGQNVQVPAFRAHPGCEVVALCASRPDRAREVADRLGIPRAFGDWRAMLGEDLDAVSLAVPPAVQYEIALAAVRSGRAVFCDKPLTATLAQGRELAAAARNAGIANMID